MQTSNALTNSSNSALYSETIRITVGKAPHARRSFLAHKPILRFYSGYFQGALKGHFSESHDGQVNLPTEDPNTFEIFLSWMYSRRLTFEPAMLDKDDFVDTLVKTWVFADAHQVPLLQNEVLDLLHHKTIEHWSLDESVLNY